MNFIDIYEEHLATAGVLKQAEAMHAFEDLLQETLSEQHRDEERAQWTAFVELKLAGQMDVVETDEGSFDLIDAMKESLVNRYAWMRD